MYSYLVFVRLKLCPILGWTCIVTWMISHFQGISGIHDSWDYFHANHFKEPMGGFFQNDITDSGGSRSFELGGGVVLFVLQRNITPFYSTDQSPTCHNGPKIRFEQVSSSETPFMRNEIVFLQFSNNLTT